DGDLLLFAANVSQRWGKDGEPFLARACELSPRPAWLRSAAQLADLKGERAESLRLWREVLETEPLAMDAHRAIGQTLAEMEGAQAARGHLQQVCGRFPHHFGLHQLWLDWLRPEGPRAC